MGMHASKAARILGRKGGNARAKAVPAEKRREWSVAGGEAAQAKLTPEQRSERGRAAARARWAKREKGET